MLIDVRFSSLVCKPYFTLFQSDIGYHCSKALVGDFNGDVGRSINGFDGVHGRYGAGQRNVEGRMSSEFCLEKELSVCQIHGLRERKRGR